MLACHGFSLTSRANGLSKGTGNMTPPATRPSNRAHQLSEEKKGAQDQSEAPELAFDLRSVDRKLTPFPT